MSISFLLQAGQIGPTDQRTPSADRSDHGCATGPGDSLPTWRRQPGVPPSGRWWIAPTAAVIGRVTLGEDVSVWFGAAPRRQRADRGRRAHQHPGGGDAACRSGLPLRSAPAARSAITRSCMAAGRPNSLVGMGATLLNGARIGANCLVGANALVTEGKEFPDRSLIVGSPGEGDPPAERGRNRPGRPRRRPLCRAVAGLCPPPRRPRGLIRRAAEGSPRNSLNRYGYSLYVKVI